MVRERQWLQPRDAACAGGAALRAERLSLYFRVLPNGTGFARSFRRGILRSARGAFRTLLGLWAKIQRGAGTAPAATAERRTNAKMPDAAPATTELTFVGLVLPVSADFAAALIWFILVSAFFTRLALKIRAPLFVFYRKLTRIAGDALPFGLAKTTGSKCTTRACAAIFARGLARFILVCSRVYDACFAAILTGLFL